MRHFVSCRTTIDDRRLPELFITEVVSLHGLSRMVVFDSGHQFAAVFWKRFCECLGIDLGMSTAFHPQAAGQTEKANAGMEQYRLIFISHQQDDWIQWLHLAEFAAINGASETMKCSQFFAVTGTDLPMRFQELAGGLQDARELVADQV